MKKLLYLLGLPLLLLTACAENVNDEDTEFTNWQARNDAYFQAKMADAHIAIAQAQAQWGDAWEEHCPYRTYRYYAQGEGSVGAQTDSILVEIVERGTPRGAS